MRIAFRLGLAFALVASLSVAVFGYVVREDRRASETRRFEQEVGSACERVVAEIERQGESDRRLIAGACQSGELVDRADIWLASGMLDDERRLSLSRIVPDERKAFDVDELLLATSDGELLGQDPMTLIRTPREQVARLVSGDTAHFTLRAAPSPALVTRCRKATTAGRAVGLVAARHLAPLVERLGNTVAARVSLGPAAPHQDDVAQTTCTLADGAGAQVPIVATKPKRELVENLARIDATILYTGLAFTGAALVVAVLLARSLGRPIAELAAEARKVASGEARPLRVRGGGEIADLAQAFDKMLEDLEATRRRLAATSRVAAWREVARRVAHEVKNPLAPIRAAVETLRRLRAREDPEFEAYFDEATRTVLDEVHRISNIVTEFTSFARLPPPRPQELDVVELARHVAALHKPAAKAAIDVVVERSGRDVPLVRADRDQIVQVLTNLVQNALDAVGSLGDQGRVRITVAPEGADSVAVTFTDNGPGVAPEIAARLFEPYATTKSHGTGLGLAIAQRIAIEHNGELSCIGSAPGAGAVFRLVLPVSGPPHSDDGPPASA
jgi:signal transduction histidine kinase